MCFFGDAQARIKRKGFIAEDIKHPTLLSTDQICDIPIENVYQWVKTDKWKKKDFEKWLRAIRVIE